MSEGESYGHFTLPENERMGVAQKRYADPAVDVCAGPQASAFDCPVHDPRQLNKPARGIFPTNAADRKEYPVYSGVLMYFPDAIAEVAHVSFVGNQQHNPGQPLHWAREKSTDQEDTICRHLMESGTRDSDGQRHSAKVAWRALANLQLEIEEERNRENHS